MPVFSIVIPTYNRKQRLYQTILSVLGQTFTDFEVLVMDDGSTDGTREMVNGLSDPRIIYSWEVNSGGPAKPRNRGLSKSSAPWICFLDADDTWLPDKLSCMWDAIKANPNVDVLCHFEILRRSDTTVEKVLEHGPFEDDFYKVLLLKGNRLSTSAVTVRRDFVIMHGIVFNTDPNYFIVEDFDFWLHLARFKANFKFIPLVLGVYNIEIDNISLANDRRKGNLKTVIRNHVYQHQKFCEKKDRLWSKIEARVEFDALSETLFDPPSITKFIWFLIFILRRPISNGLIFLDKIKLIFKKWYLRHHYFYF